MCDVDDLKSVLVGDERIPELNGNARWIVDFGRWNRRYDFRLERIVEVNNDQPFVGDYIAVDPSKDHASRAIKNAVWIEGIGTLDEVVAGFAIEKGSNARILRVGVADDDQSFIFVGHVKEPGDQVDWLLFVFLETSASGINAKRGRR